MTRMRDAWIRLQAHKVAEIAKQNACLMPRFIVQEVHARHGVTGVRDLHTELRSLGITRDGSSRLRYKEVQDGSIQNNN